MADNYVIAWYYAQTFQPASFITATIDLIPFYTALSDIGLACGGKVSCLSNCVLFQVIDSLLLCYVILPSSAWSSSGSFPSCWRVWSICCLSFFLDVESISILVFRMYSMPRHLLYHWFVVMPCSGWREGRGGWGEGVMLSCHWIMITFCTGCLVPFRLSCHRIIMTLYAGCFYSPAVMSLNYDDALFWLFIFSSAVTSLHYDDIVYWLFSSFSAVMSQDFSRFYFL